MSLKDAKAKGYTPVQGVPPAPMKPRWIFATGCLPMPLKAVAASVKVENAKKSLERELISVCEEQP